MANGRVTRGLLLAAVAGQFSLRLAIAADGNDGQPLRLEEFFVPGERVASAEIAVPRGDLGPPEPNFGPELLAIPGVYGHARAADAMEPNIRGFSFDRVATTLNGLPLVNASPERTNSPVAILGTSTVTGMSVVKGIASVTLGPPTTGGRIALTTDPAMALEGGAPFSARFSTLYNAARDGTTSSGRVTRRAGPWDATAIVFRNDLGDYTAADGRRVAARFEDYGGSAVLGWHTGTQRARLDVLTRRLQRQDAVSLPLDGRNSDSQALTFEHRVSFAQGTSLESAEWRIGYATTDPYITSEDRVSPPISAQATARTFGAGLKSTWRIDEVDQLALGLDFSRQTRRAVRTTPAGRDYIWPGATYVDAGAFAEWNRAIAGPWKLRLGGRLDDVRSDAADVDQLALGKPIRQQFVTYNGSRAAAIARHELAGAANGLLEWKRSAAGSAYLAAGYSLQPAPVMERYRAFLNALGGDGQGGNAVELGNPAVKSERKGAIEAGGTIRRERIVVEATLYYYRIDNFILRTPIGTTQPPLARMVVFGYRNIDADFMGGELGATLKPASGWSVPVSVAVANARNRVTDSGLAEIPPAEAAAAVRYSLNATRSRSHAPPWPVAAEVGCRFVAARNNPAPLDNPIFGHTGGFSVWHLRAGLAPAPHVRIEAGIENLFNHGYTEYLAPPVAPVRPARGDLKPGERVPAPGRAAWVSLTWIW